MGPISYNLTSKTLPELVLELVIKFPFESLKWERTSIKVLLNTPMILQAMKLVIIKTQTQIPPHDCTNTLDKIIISYNMEKSIIISPKKKKVDDDTSNLNKFGV